MTTPVRPIDPGTRIGHVHLKVADLDRALGDAEGKIAMYTCRLDVEALAREGGGAEGGAGS